jgi:hypothetical protein
MIAWRRRPPIEATSPEPSRTAWAVGIVAGMVMALILLLESSQPPLGT